MGDRDSQVGGSAAQGVQPAGIVHLLNTQGNQLRLLVQSHSAHPEAGRRVGLGRLP